MGETVGSERPPLAIHARCSCSGMLLVEASPKYPYDACQLMNLARAWADAHAKCTRPTVAQEGARR